MLRLRIQRATWPRPALILTDTPRPDCPECAGYGGIEREYGHPDTGEYAGSHWDPCHCWNQDRRWLLMPLPRLSRRHRCAPNCLCNEPPF
ncbi:hypothetical protein OG229_23900 [Streptomyces platensis]|uniref:hypothetical protein n=1 Tax=Streptomyces platensis TaxID=58346 RepID=UPI002E14A9E0|nr:hypothetical protein OG229_23900 [Streptomyces platensis]